MAILQKLFGITIRESATDGSDFTNPDADYRRLFLGEDGQLHVKDSAGAVTDIGVAGGVATDAIWDAAGDLAVGSGANTAAKLTKGADSTVLTISPSTHVPVWSAPAAGGGATGARLPVQEVKSTCASATSYAVTVAAPSVGNLLLCVIANEGAMDVSSITQTNVVWTKLYGSTASTAPVLEVWKGVVSSSPGTTVTVAFSGSAAYGGAHVSEWTGLAGTLDNSASRHVTGEGTVHKFPPMAPTVATALVLGAISQNGYGCSFAYPVEGLGLTRFPSTGWAGTNQNLGVVWGFPGATQAYGFMGATAGYTTATSILVSVV